jgi:trimethylamine--corrinoid protein Co-methyltransferase
MGLDSHDRAVEMSLLSGRQRREIHGTALRVLRNVGVVTHGDRAVDLLADEGCIVEDGPDGDRNRVSYPPGLVEWAIDAAPSMVTLWHRNRSDKCKIGGENVYWGTGPTTPNVLDHQTREIRPGTKDDVGEAAVVVDYARNVDFCMPFCLPSDVPEETAGCHGLDALLRTCRKPIVQPPASDPAAVETCLDLLTAEAGSERAARKKPRGAMYVEPTSPLELDAASTETALACADADYPVVVASMPQSGSSAPISLSGTLVLTVAEFLAELVLIQLVSEGAPTIMGTVGSAFDVKATRMTYGGPELATIATGLTELGRFYDLPTFGTAGATDAKRVDAQAGLEASHTVTTAAMSGTNMVHGLGYMASGSVNSMEQLLLGDHLAGMAERYVRGIDLSTEMVMEDLIEAVGPGGDYISRRETLDHIEQTHFAPLHGVADRRSLDESREHPTTAFERANTAVRRILDEHTVPALDEDVQAELDAIVDDL